MKKNQREDKESEEQKKKADGREGGRHARQK